MAFGDKVDMANPVVVKEEQQIKIAEARPIPAYSRLINLEAVVMAGSGNELIRLSSPLGNRIWLLSCTINIFANSINGDVGGFWRLFIHSGGGSITSEEASWKLPSLISQFGVKPYFYYVGPAVVLPFNQKRFLEGNAIRLGLWAQNFADTQAFCINACLEISEG